MSVHALIALCLAQAGEDLDALRWLNTLDVASVGGVARDWMERARKLLDGEKAG